MVRLMVGVGRGVISLFLVFSAMVAGVGESIAEAGLGPELTVAQLSLRWKISI
ncbi:hypothetical protein PAECIP111891_04798 [Paenibacillus allorhizoplanae]|uniref:Uncharacterized protein n=1 Tax=Paenibacillus allorhizoplanae TaxID=2905648 RepID=A0ABM9CQ56_9BACL|nr:hypothetical protein PAECIP111891_04798 [Paenibacillus allorhizoplanae]